MSKSILYSHRSNSVQKTARKNTKYSRNETMLKIGGLGIDSLQAIAFAKRGCLGIAAFVTNGVRYYQVAKMHDPTGATAPQISIFNERKQNFCVPFTFLFLFVYISFLFWTNLRRETTLSEVSHSREFNFFFLALTLHL